MDKFLGQWPGNSRNKGATVGDEERFNRNHIRLSQFHTGLAIAWAAFFGLSIWYGAARFGTVETRALVVTGAIPVLLHAGLAWGTRVKSEIARKLSVAAGVLMFIWTPGKQVHQTPYFAYIALFMLPLTQWKAAPPTFPNSQSPVKA